MEAMNDIIYIMSMWPTTIIVTILVFSFVAIQVYLYKETCTVGSPVTNAGHVYSTVN